MPLFLKSFRIHTTVVVAIFFVICVLERNIVSASSSSKLSPAEEILMWIDAADGGFVHPHLQLTKDSDSHFNPHLVATQHIPKGTMLAQIPSSHILSSKSDDPEEESMPLSCEFVAQVTAELASFQEQKQFSTQRSTKSAFGPLFSYLTSLHNHKDFMPIPSAWSAAGRRLVNRISYELPPMEPTDWVQYDLYEVCGGTPTEEQAALWIISYGDELRIAPIIAGSFIQHRNGNYTNVDFIESKSKSKSKSTTDTSLSTDINVVAIRDIEAGEGLFTSYNICSDCGARTTGYGTPEIFRDYGIVEDFPQRWHFRDLDIQFDLDFNGTHYDVEWQIKWQPFDSKDYPELQVWLRYQARRVLKLRNFLYRDHSQIPEREWNKAWDYGNAMVVAMLVAADSLEYGTDTLAKNVYLDELTHYHPLTWEYDDIDYKAETCDNDLAMEFPKHRDVELVQTPYQMMKWTIEPDSSDVLLELDRIVQIASIYRPQYHEYTVHAAARFIKDVKRVIFIGGGDSMLLHEVLKYPDLELVVGLELDQMVVRKSFQYFHTQPHFDDPRVEWWFGDATKSLLLLQKEYWQSFDLVLVDLSETVMSLSVTKELDVFDALALLLKPEGVMVKNEQYFGPLSEIFDHSVQIVYECPIICDQVLVMGSNAVDFLHAPLYDHGVSTLLYEPLVTAKNNLDLWHDYQVNDARLQGKCNEREIGDRKMEQFKSAGIMEVIDMEDVDAKLDDSLAAILREVLAKNGFHAVDKNPIMESGNSILLVFEEGYLIARMWPSRKYVSMDINLWGRFDQIKELINEFTVTMKSSIVSKFRLVVGGMYGSSTWMTDRDLIGPQIIQARNCSAPIYHDPTSSSPNEVEFAKRGLEEVLKVVVQTTSNVAVVICGPVDQACAALDTLKASPKVARVIRLSEPIHLDTTDQMYDHETHLQREWLEALGSDKAGVMVVDESASKKMHQIVDSLLSRNQFRLDVLDQFNVVVAWSSMPTEEPWRKMFLENYRRHYMNDPVRRGELWMRSKHVTVEFGIVSCGYTNAAYYLRDLEQALRDSFSLSTKDNEALMDVALEVIQGGKFPWIEPWEPKEFLQSDYDNKPGLHQYFEQEPLSHHVVLQLEPQLGKATFVFSESSLITALKAALKEVHFECIDENSYQGLGEGFVFACLHDTFGSVLMTWDGRTHVDISYYRIGSDNDSALATFTSHLLNHTGSRLKIALQDEMPRGVGRTINVQGDTRTPQQLEEFYQSLKKRKPRGGWEALKMNEYSETNSLQSEL